VTAGDAKVEAVLALRGSGRSSVGAERIALLEAVESEGSITRAARKVGLSYKAAWDALSAINNLLPRPAVVAQTGGRRGGGASVTEDGRALILAFRLLEERLSRVAALLGGSPTAGAADPLTLLWSLGMKTSARNAYRCTVLEVRRGAVDAEIILRLTDATTLSAVITTESVRDLDIHVGREATALIKAPFVLLAGGEAPPRVSARNRIPGIVATREDGTVNSEIVLDIGGGKTLAAIVTRDSADALDLRPGSPAWALFQSSHVILAVD
jgi:molybdate transport system regulatory protein